MSRMYIKNRIGRKVARGVFMIIALLVFVAIAGFMVKFLWNAILPDIFGWQSVTFPQALGLLLLTRILFGGFGWHKKGSDWSSQKKAHWRKKWSNMNEEDKAAFKAKWKERCK